MEVGDPIKKKVGEVTCLSIQSLILMSSSLRASSPIWATENAQARGRGKESLQRSLINFHFHPGNPATPPAKRENCHRKRAAD